MKRAIINLVTLVFVLGIVGTAFAAPASQFSDVPAKHWAYDAVKKLAKDGIVEGYGDGTFRGDRTMTRYEMAQIVANAITKLDKADAANKALVNKLAAEFADELASLNVRLTKVEKNQGKITWSGDEKFRWIKWQNAAGGAAPAKEGVFQNNLTFTATARVNEDVTGTFKFIALRQNSFGSPSATTTSPDNNETNSFIQADVAVRNFWGQKGVTVTAGRMNQLFGASGFIMCLQGIDGAKVAFGKQLKMEIGAADFSNPLSNYQKTDSNANAAPAADANYGYLYFKDAVFAKALYSTSKATNLQAFYLKNTSGEEVANVYGLGVSTKVAPNLLFRADYVKNTTFDEDNTNQQYRLTYRGATPAKAGTWGVNVDYGKAYARASFGWGDYNTTSLYPKAGVQSWNVSYEQTLLKDVQLKIGQSFNSKNPVTGAKSSFGEWSRVEVDFFF